MENKDRVLKIFSYSVLISGALLMLMPFLFMLSLSFSGEEQIFSYTPKFFPENFTLENYKSVFETVPIKQYFLNSFYIATVTTIGQVFISALAGYAFARLNFRFKEPLFIIILIIIIWFI